MCTSEFTAVKTSIAFMRAIHLHLNYIWNLSFLSLVYANVPSQNCIDDGDGRVNMIIFTFIFRHHTQFFPSTCHFASKLGLKTIVILLLFKLFMKFINCMVILKYNRFHVTFIFGMEMHFLEIFGQSQKFQFKNGIFQIIPR